METKIMSLKCEFCGMPEHLGACDIEGMNHAKDCAVNFGFAANDVNGECDCKTSHTPTPWKIAGGYHLLGNDGTQIATLSKGDDFEKEQNANAAFIVTACNAHEELVKACKELLSLALEGNISNRELVADVCEIGRQALAKAGVKV